MVSSRQHWINWFLLAMFFFMHYFIRISPALMSLELMQHFSISVGRLGLLSSLYFLTYTVSQIPIGYLMTQYSSRALIVTACFSCALTAIAFSMAPSFPLALTSLLLYSFFSAFGFIIAVSYGTTNLPTYGSLIVGMTQSSGMAAGFIATNWITYELTVRPWFQIVQRVSGALIILGIIIFLLFPTAKPQPMEKKSTNDADLKSDSSSVYWNTQTWTNSLYAGLLYFPLMVFTEGGLGSSLLSSIHHHSREDIAFAISMIFIAWMIGGPICGLIADRYGRTRIMRLSAISGIVTSGYALFVPMSSSHLAWCLFVFGITNTGIVGCYSIASDMHGPKNASISIAIANMMTILIGSILGGILPSILELTSHVTIVDGIAYYAAADYQRTFGIAILTSCALAYICAALTKEPSVK